MTNTLIRRRLRKRADEIGLDFQQAIQYYAIEKFLYRLSTTEWADRMIVKGATMLRVWEGAVVRPTRDIDFAGRLDNSFEIIQEVVSDCLSAEVAEDALVFEQTDDIQQIAQESSYPGFRVNIRGNLDGARFTLRLDIGIGDAAVPEPGWVDYPVLLDGPSPRILAYNPATAIAEKFETMVKLGLVNSRIKDYFDIWMLATTLSFDRKILSDALIATFERRQTPLPTNPPIALSSEFTTQDSSRRRWKIFQGKLARAGVDAPIDLEDVVKTISDFLIPTIQNVGVASSKSTWTPGIGWE